MAAAKWVLIFFAVAALTLVVLSKVIVFLNPPRPGRAAPPVLRRVERAIRWTIVIPAVLGLALIAATLARG